MSVQNGAEIKEIFHEIFRWSSQCLVELQPALGTFEQGLIRWNFSKLKISWANQESDWGAKQPKRDINFPYTTQLWKFPGKKLLERRAKEFSRHN